MKYSQEIETAVSVLESSTDSLNEEDGNESGHKIKVFGD